MMADHIVHLNIRGLNSDKKKEKLGIICKELEKPQTKILNIQETRIKDTNVFIKNFDDYLINYNFYFSNATDDDAGGGILIFIKKTEEIISQSSIINGRLLYVRIKNNVSGEEFNIFSFYGKSNTDKQSAEGLISAIETKVTDDSLENIIIIGDYNFVTSILDRKSGQFIPADNLYRDKWTQFEINVDIVDAFRKLCPKKRLYTFFQGGSIPKSRIDRLYISNDISGKILSVNLETNPFSDHKILRVKLLSNIERGPGSWIFNTSLLKNELFVNNTRNIIDVYKRNREDFPTIKIAWDFCKMEVNSIAKKCSKKIANEKRREIDKIRHEIEILQS